jgi:hypothetical protein
VFAVKFSGYVEFFLYFVKDVGSKKVVHRETSGDIAGSGRLLFDGVRIRSDPPVQDSDLNH